MDDFDCTLVKTVEDNFNTFKSLFDIDTISSLLVSDLQVETVDKAASAIQVKAPLDSAKNEGISEVLVDKKHNPPSD